MFKNLGDNLEKITKDSLSETTELYLFQEPTS